jgi:hypothetical protein
VGTNIQSEAPEQQLSFAAVNNDAHQAQIAESLLYLTQFLTYSFY